MSPNEQRNGQSSNAATGWAVESSNSTVNKFLGGMRKAWMSGATPNESPSAPTRNQMNTQNGHFVAPGQVAYPISRTPANNQQSLEAAPALHWGTITTRDRAPISPVTPIEKHSKTPVSIKHSPPSGPRLPEPVHTSAVGDVGYASILPSPEPSNGSRTSPTIVVDAERGGNREAEPMVLQSRLGQVQFVTAMNGNRVENADSLAVTRQAGLAAAGSVHPQSIADPSIDQTLHRNKRPRVEVSHSASLNTTMPLPSPTVPDGSTSPSASSDNDFWDCSMHMLSQLENVSSGSGALSESVEWPRVRLLQEACRSEDLFYVALHQVFCLRTFAPSEFVKLASFGVYQEGGLEIIKQLLLDNIQLSGDFLKWCVNFPFPISHMLQNVKYRNTLKQIGQCLALLSRHWISFEQETKRRSYPPLIDELIARFHIISPILQNVMFTATCRRHINAKDDVRLQRFLVLFERNRQNYHRRFANPLKPVSTQQMQKENEDLIRDYQSLWVQCVPRDEPQRVNSLPAEDQRTNQIAAGSLPQAPVPASSVAINGPRPPLQSPTSPQFPSHPYSHAIAATPVASPHGTPNAPANPQMFVSGTAGPVQVLAVQQSPQNLSPTYFLPPGAVSPGGHQNPRPVRFAHYVPPAYGVPTQQMPSQMAQPSQVTQPPRGRGRGRRAPPNVQIQTSAPPVILGSPGVSPLDNRFIPAELATRMVQREPVVSPAGPPRQALIDRHLLPAPGAIPPPRAHPSPIHASLHQLHLRDPAKKLVRQGSNGQEEAELFQYIHSFAVDPTSLGKTEIIFEFKFNMSSDVFGKLPHDTKLPDGQRAIRILSNGNLLYRLRCIKVTSPSQHINENSWAIAESVWPSIFYLHVNGKEMFVRRKTHHGKDLPLDITPNLKEGVNEVKLHFLRSSEERDVLLYALAVEVLEIADLGHVKSLIQPLTASESYHQIQKRLSINSTDDELAVVDDYIAIDLVDPFMARIFDVPVRGKTCKHQECFDLDAFLNTRISKSGNSPMKENWKCPICGEDCRPQSLIIDEFLSQVRTELQRSGRLEETKAIHVKADGTWQAKVEQQSLQTEGSRIPAKRKSSEMDNEGIHFKSRSESGGTPSRLTRFSEVIELD